MKLQKSNFGSIAMASLGLIVSLLSQSTSAAAGPKVNAVFTDTYLTRLLDQAPQDYEACLKLGPTPENAKDKLCARATRLMYSCAADVPAVHCGSYAFTYAGRNCLEKRGLVNLMDPQNLALIRSEMRAGVCNVPGAILVFEGRCRPAPNSKQVVNFKECRQRLMEIEGAEAYQKRIGDIMQKMNITEAEAISGDQVGHIELAIPRSSKDRGTLNFVSYSRRAMPASHFDTGKKHGYRILVACYLPKSDAQALVQFLNRQ